MPIDSAATPATDRGLVDPLAVGVDHRIVEDRRRELECGKLPAAVALNECRRPPRVYRELGVVRENERSTRRTAIGRHVRPEEDAQVVGGELAVHPLEGVPFVDELALEVLEQRRPSAKALAGHGREEDIRIGVLEERHHILRLAGLTHLVEGVLDAHAESDQLLMAARSSGERAASESLPCRGTAWLCAADATGESTVSTSEHTIMSNFIRAFIGRNRRWSRLVAA